MGADPSKGSYPKVEEFKKALFNGDLKEWAQKSGGIFINLSGDYPAVIFETVGNIGFYTSPGATTFHILEASEGYAYFRNIGEDGLSWYNMMTTADYLSTIDNEILDMRIYPNPVDGNYVTILSPVQGLKQIEVFTVTGRKVMDTIINNSTLDVSSFNTGFYMLKVTINGQSKVSKLVVR